MLPCVCILLFFIDEFDIVVDQIDGRQRVGGEVLIEMDFVILAFDADNHAVEQARAVDDDVLFFNFLVFNQGIEKTHHARSIGGKVLTLAVRKILRAADEDEQQQRNNAQVAVFGVHAVAQVLRYGEQEDDEGGENQDVFQVVVEIHMIFKIKVRKEFHGI